MPQIDIDPATGAPIVKPTTSDFTAQEPNTTEAQATETKTEAASTTVGNDTSTETKQADAPSTDKSSAGTTETPATTELSDKEKRKHYLTEECSRLEKEADGFGNIGMTSPYWDLRKELQGLK